MESEIFEKQSLKWNKIKIKKKKAKKNKIILLIIFIPLCVILFLCFIKFYKKLNNKYKEFDENFHKKYIENQRHFCKSNDLFFDPEIENKINKVTARLNNISFSMYVYKSTDYVSDSISGSGIWERNQVYKVIGCLNYYSKKMNLIKNQIIVLDIGANIGSYSFYLANAGYEVFSFEISQINSYILKKIFA